MSDHLSYIRIRGLSDSDSEVFQGLGADMTVETGGTGGTSGGTSGGSPSDAPESQKEEFDLGQVWEAQNRFSTTLLSFLSALDPGSNTDAGNLITDFTGLLESTQQLDASLEAFNLQRVALGELPIIWETLNRLPSKETIQFVKDADAYATELETWFQAGLSALYNRDAALDAVDAAQKLLAAATTTAAVTAAQSALQTAQENLTAAEGDMTATEQQLPVDTLPQKMVALMVLVRAVMTGNWMLVGVTLIRICVPLLIDYIAKWIGGKLPGRKPQTQDLQPIVDALRDLALQDTYLRFGDHVEIHEKAELLHY